MLLGILEVITGADIADDAAEAARGNIQQVGRDDGLFLVEGGLGGVGEVVDDLEGEVVYGGGHGKTPFVE
jgi:hypothetical protein